MSLLQFPERVSAAYETALSSLLAERTPKGYWTGELSTSALSTATAVSALALVARSSDAGFGSHSRLIAGGLAWLAEHQNVDGGWGDTIKSVSNISTSMLCLAAFHIAGKGKPYAAQVQRVEGYLQRSCGVTREQQAEAIRARYGKDRTFAVPILTTCALAGLLLSWREVTPLPFELACFPQAWFRFLRLPVVSYALPALIALGQARYFHRRPRNPLIGLIRRLALRKSLRVLEAIQPSGGGFLEATPLTSFVTLSLASIGLAGHAVARKGIQFLVNSVRPDGSWAIDSNLSTWVTTLSINALAAAGNLPKVKNRAGVQDWLLSQQFTQPHPYTGSDPGAWGWTDLSGSVPDADDTSGALLALSHLAHCPDKTGSPDGWIPILRGLRWLLDLQNRDGGWPTFCRGWGHLPFDRSGADLTAHAVRALAAWSTGRPTRAARDQWKIWIDVRAAIQAGLIYLARQQRPDGSWLPLWFGNEFAPGDENPTYGTARVLVAYRDLDMMMAEPARRGTSRLLHSQNLDGGWGGAAGVASSIEETALAVDVLFDAGPEAAQAAKKGVGWLVQQVESGGLNRPTPIGFYFAKLWYFEKLYPVIFTVAALGHALRKLSYQHDPACWVEQA